MSKKMIIYFKTLMASGKQPTPPIEADSEVIVVVPAEDVLLTQIKMPKLSRHRLREALPYALEEQLLTEVSELHFAIGDYQADNLLPAAIVTKQKMDDWLSLLKQKNLSPSALIPASLALPFVEGQWSIAIDETVAIVRTGLYSGFACDKNNLQEMIDLKLAEETQKPSVIHISHSSDQPVTLEIPGVTLTQKNLPLKAYPEMMSVAAETPVINLLQNPYQAKYKSANTKKIWLIAGYLSLAWVGVLLVSRFISLFILHYQVNALETSINHIYKNNFPEATAIVSPKERMAQKLNDLTTQNNKNLFLVYLGYVAKSSAEVRSIQIQQLVFHNNLLNLELSAPSFDHLDKFTQSLTRQDLTVKQQGVKTVGAAVKGTLIISKGHAT